MTPNQARAIPASVARLLASGERQGLTPEREIVEVSNALATGDDRVYVFTYWTEPEGAGVMLSEAIKPDGTALPRDARWTDDESPLRPDPDGEPGVRIAADGQPLFWSAWLDS